MPYTHTAIEAINAAITAKLSGKQFTGAGVYGIAQLLPSENGTIPSLVDHNGGATFAGFDDSKPMVIYHRALSLTTTEADAAGTFGDGGTRLTDAVRMRCVVYADRYRTRITNVDLASVIMSAVRINVAPTTNTPGLFKMSTEAISAELDPVRVFTEEYQLTASQYKVPTGANYFAVNYTILTEYETSSIEYCPSC